MKVKGPGTTFGLISGIGSGAEAAGRVLWGRLGWWEPGSARSSPVFAQGSAASGWSTAVRVVRLWFGRER